jgi:uncharacterized membrane-anchored protein YitT (DUF2179 family)
MSKFKTWLAKEKQIIVKELTFEPPRKLMKNIGFIILGAIAMAIGESFFLVPMNIISGGATSMALFTQKIPGLNSIPVTYYILIINWIFFLIGLIFIGLKYSMKTLVFTIVRPLLVLFFTFIVQHVVIKGMYVLDLSKIVENGLEITLANGSSIPAENLTVLAYFVAAVLGGALIGVGMGLCYAGGGSSGGTDVICLLLNKFLHLKMGTASFITDVTLILVGFFVVNNFNLLPTLVGVISSTVCAIMLDRVFLGNNQYYLAQIVSPEWEKINQFINNDLGRGTTLIHAQGGYTKKETTIIEACFDKQDYALIKQSIYGIDPNAFVSVMQTQEILGYGFSRDKPKVDAKDMAMSPDDARRLVAKASRKRKKTFYYDQH